MISFIPRRYSQPKWQAHITESDKQFYMGDDITVASLYQLKSALTQVSEEALQQHLGEDHHIANWIEFVIKNQELADELRKHHHRWGMIVALERQQMRTLNLPPHIAKYWLRSVELSFTFVDGNKVSSSEELATALEKVSDEDVDFHLEREPNDIARWMLNVIGDYELAELLEESSNKAQMHRFTKDHILKLQDSLA